MPEFKFFIDNKITAWEREPVTIYDCKDEQEAIEIAKGLFNRDPKAWLRGNMSFQGDTTILRHTKKSIDPIDNEGKPTRELTMDLENGHDVPICDNATSPIQNPHV